MRPTAQEGRIRTLVVEGDWILRCATSLLLKQEADIQVVGTAKDGLEALDKAEAVQPDLVVAELAMPNMGGLELAFLLRHRFPAIGIVMIGAAREPEIDELCTFCGVDVLMNKSFLPAKLPAVIRMVAAHRKRLQEREARPAVAEKATRLESVTA